MVPIKKNLVSSKKYSIKCPYFMTPEFIVVHNTSNNASAANEIKYMIGNDNSTSFHYAVDDVSIIQGIPENRNAWHAGDGATGDGNRKGLSIEICYSKSGGEKFNMAETNAAEFCAHLLRQYGWGIDKVKKHQDFSGKYCPHRTLDMGWDRFLNMVKKYLETPIFKDLQSTHWAFNHIADLYKFNIIKGYGDNTFKPNKKITRAEMATIIYNACSYIKPFEPWKYTNNIPFNDVPSHHWAFYTINVLHGMGITNGVGKNLFAPNDTITRAEACVMIRRAIALYRKVEYLEHKLRFNDILSDHWAYDDIHDLYNMGIINGVGNSNVDPSGVVTRAEVSVMVRNMLTYLGK